MKLDEYRKQLARDPDYLAAQEEIRPLLDLADRVLAQRLARNWSQSDLAERVGTKQANISRLESGLSNPSIKFLQKVAEALDAHLTIRLDPRVVSIPSMTMNTVELNAQDAEAILVTNWPQRISVNASDWDDHAHASSLEETTL